MQLIHHLPRPLTPLTHILENLIRHVRVHEPRTNRIHMHAMRRAIHRRRAREIRHRAFGCAVRWSEFGSVQAEDAAGVENPAAVAAGEGRLGNHLGCGEFCSVDDAVDVYFGCAVVEVEGQVPDGGWRAGF